MQYTITIGLGPGDLHLVLEARRRSLRLVFAAPGRPAAHLVLPAPRLGRLVAALHDWPLDLLAELARAEPAAPPPPFPRPPDPRFSARAARRELTGVGNGGGAAASARPGTPRRPMPASPRAREAASIGEALERLADAVLAWRAGEGAAPPAVDSPVPVPVARPAGRP